MHSDRHFSSQLLSKKIALLREFLSYLLIASLISILLLFLFAHIATINYPYFMEDEATYRVLGSFHELSLDAGFVWKIFYAVVRGLDVSNYRYICAFDLLIIAGAILGIFMRAGRHTAGILAAIIFLASPISFYVFHLTRPEIFHTALAICAIACCSSFRMDHYSTASKSADFIPQQIVWYNYIFLICAMLLNLSLPHVHMFGIVHMPATFIIIMLIIITLPLNLFFRLGIGLIFTVVEFLDMFYFLSNSPSFGPVSTNVTQGILSAFFNIYNQPGSLSIYDTAARAGNEMPVFLTNFFSSGQYLKVSTALLLLFGIFGAVITVIRSVVIKSFDVMAVLGVCVLIFMATFFVSTLKMGYVNYSYISVLIPWAAIGCALGVSFFIERISMVKQHYRLKFSYIIFMIMLATGFAAIVLMGVGQLYTYSWPLRYSSFPNTVEAIKMALIENSCQDVPYISAPYQGFVSMVPGKRKIKFAPDFIVLYTTNLNYMYESRHMPGSFGDFYDKTLDRINKPESCIVASARQLFSLGTFGMYANTKVGNFIMDNFFVVKQIQTPFYYGDTFPSGVITKFDYDVQVGAPFLHHGSIESVFVLKAKRNIDMNLITKYINTG